MICILVLFIPVIDLPRDMLYPKMLPTPSQNGVYIFDTHGMYELVCNTANCDWEKKLDLEIGSERQTNDHIVMYIPDTLSNCPAKK